MESKYKVKIDNKMRAFGDTDFQKKLIRINKRKSLKSGPGELLDTIKHELTHAKHPKMGEKRVRSVTETVLKRATTRQKSRLYGMIKKKRSRSKLRKTIWMTK